MTDYGRHSTIIAQKRADYALGYQHGSDQAVTEPDASNAQHPKSYYDGFIKGAKDRAKALPKYAEEKCGCGLSRQLTPLNIVFVLMRRVKELLLRYRTQALESLLPRIQP